jgi:hypothetical protein
MRASRDIVKSVHNLGSYGDKCLSSRSGSFTLEKELVYMGLGGPQSRRGDVEKKNTLFCMELNHDCLFAPWSLFTLTVRNKFVLIVQMNSMLQRFNIGLIHEYGYSGSMTQLRNNTVTNRQQACMLIKLLYLLCSNLAHLPNACC